MRCVLAAIFAAVCSVSVAAPPNFRPVFEPAPVPREVVEANGTTNVRFGYVTVPEDRSDPANHRTLRVAVAVLPRSPGAKSRDMTIYLAGGPGGSGTIRGFKTFFRAMSRDNDVVLLDQRGTGFAQPSLLNVGRSTAEMRNYYVSRGVNLAAINSRESAADVEDVRIALGYEWMNVVGGSYGTFLTQQVNRFHPDRVRCSVLIGNMAPTNSPNPIWGRTVQRAFEALFKDVRRTPRAKRAFPRLERRTYALIRRLDQEPILTRLRAADSGRMEPVRITGRFLITSMRSLLETPHGIRNVPFLIDQLERRGATPAVRKLLTPQRESRRVMADGMYHCISSQEFYSPGFLSKGLAVSDTVHPALREYFRQSMRSLADQTRQWKLPINRRGTRARVFSDIPSFFVNGAMDTQTAPDQGAVASAGYSRAFNVIFPRNGHHVGEESPGPEMDAILAFLRNPHVKPPIRLGPIMRRDFYRMRANASEIRRLAQRAPTLKGL
jgi:Predicted hydrolases or acyltransferases (alpha/beta hydrolase superfamily)